MPPVHRTPVSTHVNGSMPFTKMHGCGNDYVYLDCWDTALPTGLPALATRLSDRHTGIGADGLIVLTRSTRADARMIMFNSDGSESEMCGNGLRCTAKLAYDHGHVPAAQMTFETGAGILAVTLRLHGQRCDGGTVSMGPPRLDPSSVPVIHPGPGPLLALDVPFAGRDHHLIAVGMGNPHAVYFIDSPNQLDSKKLGISTIGPHIENHTRFPRRTNVEFVSRGADEDGVPVLRQLTWERGSGETLACGTGACATLVAAILTRRIPGREAIIRLTGGDLFASWPTDHSSVELSGDAVTVFTGEFPF